VGGTTLNFLNIADNSEATEYCEFSMLNSKPDLDAKLIRSIATPLGLYRANFGIAQPYGISMDPFPMKKYFFAGVG